MFMLIEQEISQNWERVLKSFTNVEKLEKEGKWREAVNMAEYVVLLGCAVIIQLSEEQKNPTLKDTASYVCADWVEAIDAGKQQSIRKEPSKWAFKLLKRLYDAAPPSALLPLK
jgi:hypothetical protein